MERERQIATHRKFLYASLAVAACCAAVELALWAGGVATLIESEDPFRGFSGLVSVFEADGETYRTRRGSLDTFNEQTFLVNKPEDGFRLFTLGGSSAYGFPWGADAAFTSIIGEALAAAHPARRIEAVNASGVSYAMHRLNIVADELLAYEPDVFIVYSGHNEFVEPAFFDALERRHPAHTRLEYLASHSRLYSGMRATYRRLAAEPPPPVHDVGTRVRRDQTRLFDAEERDAVVAEYRRGLERLVRRARAEGVELVLVTVPANLREWRAESSTGTARLSAVDHASWSAALLSGTRQLERGEFAAASASLEQATRLAPGHGDSQFLLARAYEGLGRWDDAREAYRRACDADASPVRRVSGINEAIRDVAREHGTLLVDADRIFEQRSEHGLVGFNLIEDYVHPTREGHEIIARHVWEAIEAAGWLGGPVQDGNELFETVIAQRRGRPVSGRNSVAWHYNQGVVLEHQGDIDASIGKYRESLALDPGHTGTLLNLGSLLRETGELSEAVELLGSLVALDPDDPLAHSNLGNALDGLGRHDEAIARYRDALRLDPELAQAHNNWGNALQASGRSAEALEHYERAVSIEPGLAEAHHNWGVALARLGRLQDAVTRYRHALRIDPGYAETHFRLADALQKIGRLEQAVEHFEQTLELRPDHPAATNSLGWLLATCPVDAIRDGERAMELAGRLVTRHGPGRFAFLDTVAAAHAEAGQFADAASWQEQAIPLAPLSKRDALRERLELYRQRRPFRDTQRAVPF